MKYKALRNLLEVLAEKYSSCTKTRTEINKMRGIIESPDLPHLVETTCRSLQLVFVLLPTMDIKNLVGLCIDELLSWNRKYLLNLSGGDEGDIIIVSDGFFKRWRLARFRSAFPKDDADVLEAIWAFQRRFDRGKEWTINELITRHTYPNSEKVLEAVDKYLDDNDTSEVMSYLILSSLLATIGKYERGAICADGAYIAATNSGQSAEATWARQIAVWCYTASAEYFVAMGYHARAEKAYRRLLELKPNDAVSRAELGELLLKSGELSDARNEYEEALKTRSRLSIAWMGIARSYFEDQDFEKALCLLFKGMKTCGESNPQFHFLLACIQSKASSKQAAKASFERAISLECDFPTAWYNLGVVCQNMGDYDAAIKAFIRADELGDIWAPLDLAQVLCMSGDFKKAVAYLERFLRHAIQTSQEKSLTLVKEFKHLRQLALLTDYGFVMGCHLGKPPGTGESLVDQYLLAAQQIFSEGFKIGELSAEVVVDSLLHIGMLWTLYAEKLPEKGLSKQFARERLYSIEHDIVETAPQVAKTSGFTSAWPELEARMKTTSPEEFAREMLIQEPKWLREVGEGQRRGEREDLRWRLQGNLWVHVFEYQHERQLEHLERTHYYMELLKGNSVLHRLAQPQIMGSAINVEKWNRYVNSLPVKVYRTAVVDLKSCMDMLPQNAIGQSFYFLKRELIPNLLLAFVFKPGQAPSIQIMEDGAERLGKYQEAANRLKHVHDQVAWRQKTPAIAEVFRKLTGQESERGQELVQAVAEWQKKQLVEAYKAILKGVVDEEELRGKDIYVSPSPEMYDIPFGLLCGDNGFLSNSARSITVVPIFSLKQFQRAGIFPHGPGFVLCLDENWQAEAKDRVTFLSDRWCNGRVGSEVERDLTPTGGKVEHIYDAWIRAMQGKAIIHVIGHHDASQWGRSTKSEPNLGQFGRYLYDSPEKLSGDVLALEACWAGTWSEPEDLMGLFVSLLASGVKWTIASPYSLVPTQTSRKLFENVYKQVVGRENDGVGLDIARALRDAAEAVKKPAFSGDENVIPSLWGALQLYAVV